MSAGSRVHTPTDGGSVTYPDHLERVALLLANAGEGWAPNCPEWVKDRYRYAARAAWRVVIGKDPER